MRRSRLLRKSNEDVAVDIFSYLALAVFSLAVVYPLWRMLVDSFSTPEYVLTIGLKLFPRPITLKNYALVFQQRVLPVAYFNTIIRAGAGTLLSVIVCFGAAYSLSKRRLPFNRLLTYAVVFTMFFSGGIIPTYLWFKQLHLLNTMTVLILPHVAIAFYIVLLRNFIQTIPADLEESAHIDGASVYVVLFRIILPVSKPAIATIALWSAVAYWNEWFQALIFTTDRSLMTLQLLLRKVLIENQLTNAMEITILNPNVFSPESLKSATMFVAVGPIILVYPFIQKYFVKGAMLGSLKG